MSNEESAAAHAATRRAPRQGSSPSPVGSTLSIVLAVVAVIAGFLILQNLTNDDNSGVSAPIGDAAGASEESGGTTLPDLVLDPVASSTTTTTTTIPLVTTGASVVVANANTVGGSAGAMTRTLEFEGFTMVDPVNATGPNLLESLVYYDAAQAGALDVANSVAYVLGGLSVGEVPTPVPVESGSLGDAGVLLMLGDNEAGKTVEELQATAGADPTTDE